MQSGETKLLLEPDTDVIPILKLSDRDFIIIMITMIKALMEKKRTTYKTR